MHYRDFRKTQFKVSGPGFGSLRVPAKGWL
jgi:predicted aldo/keto reductase-like oxidoreductase